MKWLRRFPHPCLWLLVLLQRTPVLRLAFVADGPTPVARAFSLLTSTVTWGATLGTMHTLAGATQLVVTSELVVGTVGTPISPVAFTLTGAQSPVRSFNIIEGSLPPGVFVEGANDGVLNASAGRIVGTPTVPGEYWISLAGYAQLFATSSTSDPETIHFTITAPGSVAPSITTQPLSRAAAAESSVALTVAATGTPAFTYQWSKNGDALPNATGATLTLTNVQSADAGNYRVVVSNSAGTATSSTATLTVNAAFTLQPASQFVAPGSTVVLTAAATGSGLTYQWKKDGVALAGATNPTLTLNAMVPERAGFYAVTATGPTSATNSTVAIVTVNTGGGSRLTNVGIRGYIAPGAALTPGFVLQGSGQKSLVIRAVGPTLRTLGLSGWVADPILDITRLGSGDVIAHNDNWEGAAQISAAFRTVGAFPYAALDSRDAAIVRSLEADGAVAYAVRITTATTIDSGIVLAEIYDADPVDSPVRLVNVSTMGFVGTGDRALVPGFYISGTAPKLLLIRAVGPGLGQFGVTGLLTDPQLSVVPASANYAVAANDNWGNSAEINAAFLKVAAFALPVGSGDAALIVRLPPGGYSVVVSGVANATGTALVEVYDLEQ